jgi:hypothetical protein
MVRFRAKIIGIILQLITLVVIPAFVSAQSSVEIKHIFAKSDSYYLFEEYEPANQLYFLLDTTSNYNLKYKIGNCYLNIADEKEKSIRYLESGVKS